MKSETVDKAEKAKINQKICPGCNTVQSLSSFSYYKNPRGNGSLQRDECDSCLGILPPEVTRTRGYVKKSQEPAPAVLVQGQPIVLDEQAITNLLAGVLAWLSTRNTPDDREAMGRLLVSEPKSYGSKQNSFSAS